MSRKRDALARREKAERLAFFGTKRFRPSVLATADARPMKLAVGKWMRVYFRLHGCVPRRKDEYGNFVSVYGSARIARTGTGHGSPVDPSKPLYAALGPKVFRARNGHDRAVQSVPDTPPAPPQIEGDWHHVWRPHHKSAKNMPHPQREDIGILGMDK